jgi:alpha-tubulin suppressor-like RCC1 family protein
VSVGRFAAEGLQIELGLGFAPLPGTNLTLVRSTGPEPITGQLANLTHGQRIELSYAGVSYPFLVNYQGGSGNDLVLHWNNTRVMAWGVNHPVPVVVDGGDVFAGRAITAFDATGALTVLQSHDGTVAGWNHGSNLIPQLVDPPGVLAGRRITRLVAGTYHALALCDDGTVAAWGSGPYGEMGNGTYTSSATPVAVDLSGVLAGRKVIDVAAGEYCGFALCADGTIGAWGWNYYQQLGTKSTTGSALPVRVHADGVLAARRVIKLASGTRHTLGLCDDGALVAWGYNSNGQLGNGSTITPDEPVLVDAAGVLAGKTVVAMGTGDSSSYVLCSDGTLAAWGSNEHGRLGNGSAAANSTVPVEVDRSGVLAGKTVSAISAGGSHVVVRCSDGTLAGWGRNSSGQLGNNSTVNSPVPVAMAADISLNGSRFVFAEGGGSFTTGVVALPPIGAAVTRAATSLADNGATLNATVMPNGSDTAVSFEYGLTEAYGATVIASPDKVSGTEPTPVSAVIDGLIPGTIYHFRVVT